MNMPFRSTIDDLTRRSVQTLHHETTTVQTRKGREPICRPVSSCLQRDGQKARRGQRGRFASYRPVVPSKSASAFGVVQSGTLIRGHSYPQCMRGPGARTVAVSSIPLVDPRRTAPAKSQTHSLSRSPVQCFLLIWTAFPARRTKLPGQVGRPGARSEYLTSRPAA